MDFIFNQMRTIFTLLFICHLGFFFVCLFSSVDFCTQDWVLLGCEIPGQLQIEGVVEICKLIFHNKRFWHKRFWKRIRQCADSVRSEWAPFEMVSSIIVSKCIGVAINESINSFQWKWIHSNNIGRACRWIGVIFFVNVLVNMSNRLGNQFASLLLYQMLALCKKTIYA